MPVDLLYFVICESASLDSRTNKLSLFNILEAATLTEAETEKEQLPAMPEFECVVSYHRTSETAVTGLEQTITLFDPDGDFVMKLPPQTFDLTGVRHRLFLKVGGLTLKNVKPGTYQFRLRLQRDNTEDPLVEGNYPLEVRIKAIENTS